MITPTVTIERRITLRLLSYWEKRRLGRDMPTEFDIDPEDIRDLWHSCFLVHVVDINKSDYQYTYLGDDLAQAYQGGLFDGHTNLQAQRYTQVIEGRHPVVDEGEFRNIHNELIKYRQCLLPLGDASGVQAIFGGMRFKIFPAN